MKRNINKYPTVTRLPAKATTVKDYADSLQVSTQHLYNSYRRHIQDGKPISFKIVLFHGINFIIPN